MKIAYIIQKFPKLSETFIAREVHNLTSKGFDIEIFSIASATQEEIRKLNSDTRKLLQRCTYIKRTDTMKHIILTLFNNKAQKAANKICRAATRKIKKYALVARAVQLSKLFKKKGITHIHAHWPYSSILAYIINKMTGNLI